MMPALTFYNQRYFFKPPCCRLKYEGRDLSLPGLFTLKIALICVGRIKKQYAKDAADVYLERIKRYSPVDVVEIKEEHASVKTPVKDVLKREGERILKALRQGDFTVVLSDKGAGFTSRQFSEFLGKNIVGGKKRLCFVTGGSFGLHDAVVEKADFIMSLSLMTFPHELSLVLLTEQIYRAFTIMKGEPYSH